MNILVDLTYIKLHQILKKIVIPILIKLIYKIMELQGANPIISY